MQYPKQTNPSKVANRNLQGNNLKVGGEPRGPSVLWARIPNPWKQEGTKSCEKWLVSKDLCGTALPQNPYSGFRSGHIEQFPVI